MKNGVEGYRKTIAALRAAGRSKFFPWFNGLRDLEITFNNAEKIFSGILLPHAEKWLKDLNKCSVLEIGYGGGALLAAAASRFGKVFGIDIHQEGDFVIKELEHRGANGVQLLVSENGIGSDLPKQQFDFIFTFTVFGHLSGFEVLESYISAIPTRLTKNGVALLHFNRLAQSKGKQTLEGIQQDMILEQENVVGWEYRDVNINRISLKVAMWKMKEICSAYGLKVLDAGPSGYPDPVRGMLYGGQYYVVVGN